jgi:hypothetical protein
MFVKEQGEGSVSVPIDIPVQLTRLRSPIWSPCLEHGVSTQPPHPVDRLHCETREIAEVRVSGYVHDVFQTDLAREKSPDRR